MGIQENGEELAVMCAAEEGRPTPVLDGSGGRGGRVCHKAFLRLPRKLHG